MGYLDEYNKLKKKREEQIQKVTKGSSTSTSTKTSTDSPYLNTYNQLKAEREAEMQKIADMAKQSTLRSTSETHDRKGVTVSNDDVKTRAEEKKEKSEKVENNKKQETEGQVVADIKKEKNEEPEEITPLILGRSLTIKAPLIKVVDIGVDSGNVSLEGEIINMDSRELKSGKFLVLYDVYDGTSTITCKSFVAPEKVKEVMGRLKGAKGIKLEGTAQFDPFAKELGVIANVIIETPGRKKEKRMDDIKYKM